MGVHGAPCRRADFTYLSFLASKFRARGPDATTTIIAALTEIRHCFPCRRATMGRRRGRRAWATGMSQNSGGRGGRITREKNKGGKCAQDGHSERTAPPLPSPPLSLSFSSSLFFFLLLHLYLSPFSLALSSPACAGERLPILQQGQDRDFNQLAGFLGPGKWLVIRLAARLTRLLASSSQPRTLHHSFALIHNGG